MDPAVTLRSDLEVDLAVIGAGAAGLLLAAALAAQGQRLRLIVLEPRDLAPNPRLWVFPAAPGHALERFVETRFDQVQLLGRVRELSRLRLDVVRAHEVQSFALDQLAAAGRHLVETQVRIDGMQTDANRLHLSTSRGPVSARWVVDTRPGALGAVPGGRWTQIGWFAQLDAADIAPGFALSRAEPVLGGVALDQSLALRDGTSLVEAVGLCPPGDDGASIKARLQARLAAMGANVEALTLRRAVLPLVTTAGRPSSGALIHAPAGAGGLRFGPGLAALRLAQWSQSAARRIGVTGRMTAPPGAPRTARASGQVLVDRLHAGPHKASAWLNQKLDAEPADAALRLLGGQLNWRDALPGLARGWLKP